MPLPLTLEPVGDRVSRVPVSGISEWMCYYAHYNLPGGDQVRAIDECVDAHLDVGIDHLVWNCGRSVVDYWSEQPNTTRTCELSDQVGGRSWAFVAALMERVCPLRRAIACCRARDMPILGRLSMNRHYGSADYAGVTSRFARDNPQFHERSRLGNTRSDRLCYAIEEVQQERLDILLEIQRIGVDGLVLDFCRQMPMLMYHEALVEPYRSTRGVDPRRIESSDPDDYAEWFQCRAEVLTGFMRRLRRAVREQERALARPCPIVARVPDNAPWLMIAYGLDIERWCAEDLVDATMLSPFPACVEDRGRYPEYHVSAAHRQGKVCFGGIGSLNLFKPHAREETGSFNGKPVYQLADRQYRAGVAAMSLYQSETLARLDHLKEMLREIGDRHLVARRCDELADPGLPADYPIGLDWHSKLEGGHSLSAAMAGDEAL